MSTDRSDCRLLCAPVGLLLPCNHIYSQYVFIDNAQEILQMMEKNSRNMLSVKIQPEQCRKPGMDGDMSGRGAYQGSASVRCHCNVIALGRMRRFRRIRNDTDVAGHDGMHSLG